MPSRTASTDVHLALLDVNDCVPMFSQVKYNFSLAEDYSTSFQGERYVGTVYATDCDTPQFNRIFYRLLNSYHQFRIDNRGRIYITRSIDREQEYVHELRVIATDGPDIDEDDDEVNRGRSYPGPTYSSNLYNTATATVRVFVDDLNDNLPHFVHPTNTSNSIHVSFQEDAGFVLTRMVAIDPDNDYNGTVSYRIVKGNPYNIFKLGDRSGDLYIASKMTDAHQGKYTLRIEAKDHGTKPLASVTDVHIFVDDSPPVGLHNDFLLGLGSEETRGAVSGSVGGIFDGLEAETMVVVYIVAGICFVCLSLLIAGAIFCRRLRTRMDPRGGGRRRQKINGFIEANAAAHDANCAGVSGYYQKAEDTYKISGEAARDDLFARDLSPFNDGLSCDAIPPERRNGKLEFHQMSQRLDEPYTIRMSSLAGHRPASSIVAPPVTTFDGSPAFAYLVSNVVATTSGDIDGGCSGGGGGGGGEFYLVPQAPTSTNASTVGYQNGLGSTCVPQSLVTEEEMPDETDEL
ncbi:unnamed protein product [Mesocestoides corti]|uniref:Cadherin domain-containing protein n=3 Tax=Mesocestoides corti TaxID=53468 RepID=A0A0R3U9D5_MESCO|nr:unnamed protein product [Mesocestoides corti]